MNELFEIEPTLSPEAEWIKKLKSANVETYQKSDNDGEWIATFHKFKTEADTELEALNRLMKKRGFDTFDEWKFKQLK